MLLSRRYMLSCNIKEGVRRSNSNNFGSSATTWIYYKLGQKSDQAINMPGISRIYLQHQDYANSSTSQENVETFYKNQAIEEGTSAKIMEILPMDCSFDREDDGNVACNWRGSNSLALFTAGFGSESAVSSPKLGQHMPYFRVSNERIGLVDQYSREQEWIIHTPTNTTTSSSRDIRGCIEYGMGNLVSVDGNFRVLDCRGTKRPYQYQGTENNSFCDQATWTKVRRLSHCYFHGQYNSFEICEKIGRNSITITTATGIGNQLLYNQIQSRNHIQSHCRDKEYPSRSLISPGKTNIRMDSPVEALQQDSSTMGPFVDRCLCIKGKRKATEVLVLPGGSRCPSSQCIFSSMAKDRIVSPSTMEIDSQGSAQITTGTGEGSGIGNTTVADSILVADDSSDDTQEISTNSSSAQPQISADRMEIIANYYRKEEGLSPSQIEHMFKATRVSTHKAYNRVWKRFSSWCLKQRIDPEVYNIKTICDFFDGNSTLAYDTLIIWRASIQSVYSVIHPNQPLIKDDKKVKKIFQAHRKKLKAIPSEDKLQTWDTDIVFHYLQSWGLTTALPLERLQVKLVVLLCLSTMWRPRSDIGRLLLDDVMIDQHGLTLTSREPKEGKFKKSRLEELQVDNQEFCPVYTMKIFLNKTASLREEHPGLRKKVFIGYIDNSNNLPTPASEKTIASWLVQVLDAAGIDTTIYKAHSFRAAAATKAYMQGNSAESIKSHANWSLSSDTFERHYLKLYNKHKTGSSIFSKILPKKN